MIQRRREEDQGLKAVPKVASRTFWDWVEKRHIAQHAAIMVTLWITVEVVFWAMDFADSHVERDSNSVGVIIGAVLTPWGLMQAAMFKFYNDGISKNNNGTQQKPNG